MITKVRVVATITTLRVEVVVTAVVIVATIVVSMNSKIADYFPLTVSSIVSVCEITTSTSNWLKTIATTSTSSNEIITTALTLLLIIKVKQMIMTIIITLTMTVEIIMIMLILIVIVRIVSQMAICLRSPPSLPQAAPLPPSSLFQSRWPALRSPSFTNINTVNFAIVVYSKLILMVIITTKIVKQVVYTEKVKILTLIKIINFLSSNRRSSTDYINGTNTKKTDEVLTTTNYVYNFVKVNQTIKLIAIYLILATIHHYHHYNRYKHPQISISKNSHIHICSSQSSSRRNNIYRYSSSYKQKNKEKMKNRCVHSKYSNNKRRRSYYSNETI